MLASQNKIVIHCPAKINLYLEVGPRRRDGFHSLRTLLARVALSDTLQIIKESHRRHNGERGLKFVLTFSAKYPLSMKKILRSSLKDNLVRRAYEVLSQRFPQVKQVPLTVRLRKKIPIQAGLGGGSSNAAGALIALVDLFGLKVSRREILSMANSLGSDVAFFVQTLLNQRSKDSAYCWAMGRGERLVALRSSGKPRSVLIVYPGFGVATVEAYRILDLEGGSRWLTRGRILPTLKQELGRETGAWKYLTTNSFEEPLARRYPALRRVKETMRRQGISVLSLSGSGSCFYGIAPSRRQCRQWAKKILGQRLNSALRCYVTAIE